MKVRGVFADDRDDLPQLKGTGARVVRTLPPKEARDVTVEVISPLGGDKLELVSCGAAEVRRATKVVPS